MVYITSIKYSQTACYLKLATANSIQRFAIASFLSTLGFVQAIWFVYGFLEYSGLNVVNI